MKNNVIIPAVAGAAVAAAVTYLFLTEDGTAMREKFVDTVKEKFPEAGEHLAAFQETIKEQLSKFTGQATDLKENLEG